MPRPQRAPILLNGRTKQISTHNLAATQIIPKMQLLLESSGTKTTHLKRNPVQSSSESARGIWSPLHDEAHKL
ncbi:39S ribosomal protein L51, mitochondrial [Malassezia pachydermatis]